MEWKVDRNGVLNPWQRSSRENRLSWRTAAAEKGSGGGRWISREESRNKKGNTVFTVEVGQHRAFHPRQRSLGRLSYPCLPSFLFLRGSLASKGRWMACKTRKGRKATKSSQWFSARPWCASYKNIEREREREREDRDSDGKREMPRRMTLKRDHDHYTARKYPVVWVDLSCQSTN